jgi:hypothetical protein
MAKTSLARLAALQTSMLSFLINKVAGYIICRVATEVISAFYRG